VTSSTDLSGLQPRMIMYPGLVGGNQGYRRGWAAGYAGVVA
jgi:hypothetical protein